jgi:hypothetical protein
MFYDKYMFIICTDICIYIIILQMLLHVLVLLQHLQGSVILHLLKLSNIRFIKLHKTVNHCMIKSVLLVKCGIGYIWNSEICNELI